MTAILGQVGTLVKASYVVAFGVAALLCLASAARARRVEDADTRTGLVALLAGSGAWAAAHVGFLVAPSRWLSIAFYELGLVVGIATVGAWLYFCSAYTGRSLHRARPFRRLAVAVFLVIVAVKLTNPIHGLYFRTEFVTEPFRHLTVETLLLHWLVMGLAYALATVGYFMIAELFWQIDHDLTPLVGMVAITGLPVVLDVLALRTELLIDITYEPLGVAAFAGGVLFLYMEELEAIKLTGGSDDPVVLLDDDDQVRDFNADALELFPALEPGADIVDAAPALAAHVDADDAVVAVDCPGGRRYYQLASNPFSTDRSRLGRTITLTDITEREQYRDELERQNDRLERFASTVSHDLRNPLNVAQGRLDLEREERDTENLSAVADALERMAEIIEDLLDLARLGQPIDETATLSLGAIADEAWEMVDTDGSELVVVDDARFEGDPDRVQQLFENLFRNSVDHAGPDVTVRVGTLEAGGFYVEDDGPGIPPDDRGEVFESGYTTAPDGTGFGLSIVTEIVEAHGWRIAVAEGSAGGARFEVTNVETQVPKESAVAG